MQMAAEIAVQLEDHRELTSDKPRGLVSSRMAADIEDVLLRLLKALRSAAELAVLGAGLLRELALPGADGTARRRDDRRPPTKRCRPERSSGALPGCGRIMGPEIAVADLARAVGMSIPSYHVHFKELTGSSPMQYVKAIRLHEARLMIARQSEHDRGCRGVRRLCQPGPVQPGLQTAFRTHGVGRNEMGPTSPWRDRLTRDAGLSGAREHCAASFGIADRPRTSVPTPDQTKQAALLARPVRQWRMARREPRVYPSIASSSPMKPSSTESPFCQNCGSVASRPKGASSSEWCLVPPAFSRAKYFSWKPLSASR